MDELDQYLLRCYQYPTARTKFRTFRDSFMRAITPSQQCHWPRYRLLSALRARFAIGRDGNGVLTVGGLSLDPPPQFSIEGGRLRLSTLP